jgi:hypothetical protein
MKWTAHHSAECAKVVLLTVAMALPVSAQEDKTPATTLAEAEARWQARRPRAYEFAITLRCNCRGLTNPPPRFRVENGTTLALQELGPDAQRVYSFYDTVDELFAAIKRAMSFGQYKIAVEYHPELGYPLKADIDPRKDVFDDEMFLQVTDFRKVDEGGGR